MSHKFSHFVLVNGNRTEVANGFSGVEKFSKWFRNAREITKLNPDLNELGAKFLVKGEGEKGPWEAVIGVEEMDLPNTIKWTFNNNVMNDRITIRFVAEGDNETRITWAHKLEFFGFFAIFFTFRKAGIQRAFEQDLENFKNYFESRVRA